MSGVDVITVDAESASIQADADPQFIAIESDGQIIEVIGNTEYIVIEDEYIVVGETPQGVPGPQGPQGQAEEDMVYAKRTDFVSDTLIYRGEAAVGSLESAAVWRVREITFGVDGDVTEKWAGGSAAFTQVWANRAALSYV